MFQSLQGRLSEASRKGPWEIVRSAVLLLAGEWDSVDPEFFVARNRLLDRESALHARYVELCMEWQELIAEIFAAERGVDARTGLYWRVPAGAVIMSDIEALRLQRLEGGPLALCRSRLRCWRPVSDSAAGAGRS
ncbi:MAG TPA: hypothetical protein VEG38_09835 [Acidimicrobiia bacterium]|nr:hypothetical protein [Acidimicrobiia bacterium]